MIVTWSTMNDTKTSVVKYGLTPASLTGQATGTTRRFVDGGLLHRSQYIHTVVITGLTPGQKYSEYGYLMANIYTHCKMEIKYPLTKNNHASLINSFQGVPYKADANLMCIECVNTCGLTCTCVIK